MLYLDTATELLEMKRVDQEMRSRSLEESNYWDHEIDKRNTDRMRDIVTQIGWPTISKVGVDASRAAWLLVQHADHDTDFQRKCLVLMKSLGEGEVDRKDIAYLEDRVRINSGQPQLYGTQFHEVDGQHEPRPIENRESVDERRLLMDLGSLQEGIEHMNEKYGNI